MLIHWRWTAKQIKRFMLMACPVRVCGHVIGKITRRDDLTNSHMILVEDRHA